MHVGSCILRSEDFKYITYMQVSACPALTAIYRQYSVGYI